MDNNENKEKEQERLKKYITFKRVSRNFMGNAFIIILGIVFFVMSIKYLMMDSRTAHDNEQMALSIVMFFFFLLSFFTFNSKTTPLLTKLMDMVNRKRNNSNIKATKQINDLHSALQKLSASQGVIVWDTLCVCCLSFFCIAVLMCGPNLVVLGVIIGLLILTFAGHKLVVNMGRIKHYDRRLCKYTKRYMDIPDENAYMAGIDSSIKKGIIAFTGYWLLTDEYMFGRLSDITYEPIAIPRSSIVHITFLFERSIDLRGLPIGILQLQLNNGKHVEFNIGRGEACNETLLVLNEQGIPWNKEDVRYSVY